MMQLVAVAVLGIAVAVRFPSLLKNRRDPVFFACLLALLAVLANIRPLLILAYETFGPGLASTVLVGGLASHLMMLTALSFIRSALASAAAPDGVRRRSTAKPSAVLAVAVAVQLATFAGAGLGAYLPMLLDERPGVQEVTTAYVLYELTFILYLLWVFAHLARTCVRYVPQMTGGMKTGFRVVAAGIGIGGVMATLYLGGLLLTYAQGDPHAAGALASWYAAARGTGTACIGIGLAIPAASSKLARWRGRQARQRIRAVWERTVGTTHLQLIPLGESASAEQRAHRMLIEIHDANMAGRGTGLTSEDALKLKKAESRLASSGASTGSPAAVGHSHLGEHHA